MTGPVTVNLRPRRGVILAIAVLGVGMMTAAYLLWLLIGAGLGRNARISELERGRAEDKQAAAEQRQLIRRLQDQVRSLGGTPATSAPTPAAPGPSAGPTVIVVTPAPTRATPSPSASRPASPRPRPSVSSSPSPTPSPCAAQLGPICLLPGVPIARPVSR